MKMNKRKTWITEEREQLRRDYADTPTSVLAKRFGCTEQAIYSKARVHGLRKSETYLASPDAYKTELTWTINARSLQNFLRLRTAPSAMWEIRRLAYALYEALPEDHKYLFTECVHTQEETENR